MDVVQVPFGKVVRCPSCMIAVAVAQPQHGIQVWTEKALITRSGLNSLCGEHLDFDHLNYCYSCHRCGAPKISYIDNSDDTINVCIVRLCRLYPVRSAATSMNLFLAT